MQPDRQELLEEVLRSGDVAQAAEPGFYGRLELVLQDGFVDLVRVERTIKPKRPLGRAKTHAG